jgi:hypothetical protein
VVFNRNLNNQLSVGPRAENTYGVKNVAGNHRRGKHS